MGLTLDPSTVAYSGEMAAAGPYIIPASLVFDGAAHNATRTPGVAGNRQTSTVMMWVKRCALSNGVSQYLLSTGSTTTDRVLLEFMGTDVLQFTTRHDGGGERWRTQRVFRDVGAWMQIAAHFDFGNADPDLRFRLWLGGVENTDWSLQEAIPQVDHAWNNTVEHQIGRFQAAANYGNFLLAQVLNVDGTLVDISQLGEFDDNGVWRPVDVSNIARGTNGFLLLFDDATNTTTLGQDEGSSINDWTLNSMEVGDQSTDTPSDNHATLNPLSSFSTFDLEEGNTLFTSTGTNATIQGTIVLPPTGKWCWEYLVSNVGGQNIIGVRNSDIEVSVNTGDTITASGVHATNDVFRFEADRDNNLLNVYKNNVIHQTDVALDGSKPWVPYIRTSGSSGSATKIRFREEEWSNPPSDLAFKPLSSANLPDVAIPDPGTHMNVVSWAGNETVRSIAGVGFNPDISIIKSRSAADDFKVLDVVRGATQEISMEAVLEATNANGLTSFDADGFSLGTGLGGYNDSGEQFVGYCFEEGATQAIDVLGYTGNGTARTISHNLGVVPEFMLVKAVDFAENWQVYHSGLGGTAWAQASVDNAATTDSSRWNNTDPTALVFSLGTHQSVNRNTNEFIAYLFAGVPGFSKFGRYEGNGNAEGVFIYLGFRPALFIAKSIDSGSQWSIWDDQRNGYNPANNRLRLDNPIAENAVEHIDLLSNGVKMRTTGAPNAAETFIYAAFARYPFGGGNVTAGPAR